MNMSSETLSRLLKPPKSPGLTYPRPPDNEKRHTKGICNQASLSLCHILAHGIRHSYLGLIYSIAAPPTTAASPPTTAQSGDSIAPAATLVAAVLAELDVAVLVLELVAEEVSVWRQHLSVTAYSYL